MSPIRQHGKIAIVALVAAAAVLLFVFWPSADDPEAPIERHPLALMTSLPIYWPEGADIASIVGGAGEQRHAPACGGGGAGGGGTDAGRGSGDEKHLVGHVV